MSLSNKVILISALVAFVEARFGQEQVPVAAIQSLTAGNPGEAATLAGSVPGTLLGAANPCDKLTLADKIVTQLGDSQDVIDAAKGLVAAEQNFNPFAVSVPSICGDASLPATEALRGIVPKVDPAVTGSDTENANSATSVQTPFDATGLSVADVMKAQGFSNFTVAGAAAGDAGAATGGNANNNNNNNNNQNQNQNDGAADANTGAADCNGNAGNATDNNNNNNNNNAGNAADNNNAGNATDNNNAGNANDNNNAGNAGAATGAADFGKCTPTMDFQLGRPGRKATEGTFLPTDPLVAQGQQDALNPNIITNRICDQLTNVCGANQAAKDLCTQAKATVQAAGTKDASTATLFNSALGF